jgi:DNA polymerase-3 subunit chi
MEVWFYHLERSTLDQVLPELLERTLARGWRAVVRVSDPHRLSTLDDGLWTWRQDSFLPHGLDEGPEAARQPIVLTQGGENSNAAQALFIIDEADIGATAGVERCFVVFDGRDDVALGGARERWKTLKAAGANLAYWKQTEQGRWEKAA